ncbi:MAG: adenosylmethionine--8-amino-7-oxononanoate transaminase [Acidobacteriota bacterium]
MSLSDRDRAVVWHPYTQMRTAPAPLAIERGEGVYLYTEDGRKILDGISSWWVNIHGHSHPKLNAALAAQAQQVEHVIFAGATHRPAVELAEKLLAVLPPGLSRVFYSDNGSTAVEVALKMAWQYWRNRGERRSTFVALENAYHGDTVGAMSASASSIFTSAFEPLLFPVERFDRLESLEELLRVSSDSVAAVLLEPMLQGAGGMIVWPAEFVARVRLLCDRYGTLLIADEVLTGFGRTGKLFACGHAGITPDIICLSKALTGGYMPLGATVATEAIYEAFLSDDRGKAFFHGHSYTGNPLACAVALASLRLFEEEPILQNVARIEEQMRAGLDPLRPLRHVKNVRVIGGVGVVELRSDDSGYLDQRGPRLAAEFLRRGLLLRPLGNVVYFMPPYVISESETAWALEQIREVLSGDTL